MQQIFKWFGFGKEEVVEKEEILIPKKKIALAFPGGGVRGALQAVFIADLDGRVEKKLSSALQNPKCKKFFKDPNGNEYGSVKEFYKGLADHIDYVGGVSVGSINAANFTLKNGDELVFQSKDLLGLCLGNVQEMLVNKSWNPLFSYFDRENFLKVANKVFGNAKMNSDSLTAKYLALSFNLAKQTKTVWTNIGSEAERSALPGYVGNIEEILLKDVVISSSSIPGLVDANGVEYTRDGTHKSWHEVDGALVCNSPIGELFSAIVSLDKVQPKNLLMISIGTGAAPKTDFSHLSKANVAVYMYNGKKVVAELVHTAQEQTENLVKAMITSAGGEFFSINPELTKAQAEGGTNPQFAKVYVEVADKYIEDNQAYLNSAAVAIANAIMAKYSVQMDLALTADCIQGAHENSPLLVQEEIQPVLAF